MPYFREQAMDAAIVDTPWNGVWQSMKIAAAAEAHEVNVAPHNFYGYLVMPDRPGWGIVPNEEAIRSHPPKGPQGLLNYGRKV